MKLVCQNQIGILLALIVGSFVFLGNGNLACAEQLDIFGVQFDLDDLQFLDSNTVQVSLFSDSRIVKQNDLPLYIIKQYATRDELLERISLQNLNSFMRLAIAKDPAIALFVLRDIFEKQQDSDQIFLSLSESFSEMSGWIEILKAYILSVNQRQEPNALLAKIIILLAENDPGWVRSRVLKLVYSHRHLIQAELQLSFVDQIRAQQMQKALAVLEIERELYGSSDVHYQRLLVIFNKLEHFQKQLTFDDELEYLKVTRQFADDDPIIRDALEDSVSSILHQRAEEALKNGDLDRAIRFLVLVDFNKRTPTTYQLLHKVLGEYSGDCSRVLGDSRMLLSLIQLSKQDSSLLAQLERVLAQQVNSCLQNRELDRVEPLFDALLKVRPDPSSANDRLRLKHASLLRDEGKNEFGRLKQAEIQSRFILFKLMLQDAFNTYLVAILALVGVILIYLGYRLREQSSAIRMGGRRSYSVDGEGSGEKIGADRRFVMSSALSKFDPRLREYESCLRFFGLPPDADLNAIRAAFRNAVKSHHPDVSCDERALASQKFIEVTQIHDRIIELRKLMKKEV